jgi:hypothetical protein
MQNAYRNFTNRIEEALGDSAVLRVYNQPACFGFWFFMLDGPVARGRCSQHAPAPRLNARGRPARTKGVTVNAALVEEGGDYFKLPDAPTFHRLRGSFRANVARQDAIAAAQRTLRDMLTPAPAPAPTIHYDAIAFVPATIRRAAHGDDPGSWRVKTSETDAALHHGQFFHRLAETARLRGFI